MLVWIASKTRPLNLRLARSHQTEIIIVKRLIQRRNNVTSVLVEPNSCNHVGRKNNTFALSAALLTTCWYSTSSFHYLLFEHHFLVYKKREQSPKNEPKKEDVKRVELYIKPFIFFIFAHKFPLKPNIKQKAKNCIEKQQRCKKLDQLFKMQEFQCLVAVENVQELLAFSLFTCPQRRMRPGSWLWCLLIAESSKKCQI